MRFHIVTLGCPKNTVDSEMMAELLEQAGHHNTTSPRHADVIVVNTCGFIAPAREESIETLQELAQRKRKGQRLVAAGCLAERLAEAFRVQVPGVDAVIGTQSWPQIVDLFRCLKKAQQVAAPLNYCSGSASNRGHLIASVRRRASGSPSAYLKIADGCDAACGFCAIPLIKGPQRSKPTATVLREARELAAQGVREGILIAQDTTAYGRDLGQVDALPDLLRAVAQAAPDLSWLRILYAYPQFVTQRLVDTMAGLPNICHYLDLPLQHGHPDVLRRMRRPHDLDQIHRTVEVLRRAMPDVALRTTFIVGYPGETEAEFQGLLDLIESTRFDHVGVFAFSREEGTYAAALPEQVPSAVAAERYERAMLAQQAISLEHNMQQVGRELPVLIEGVGDGISVGRSYREAPEIDGVILLTEALPVGQLVQARIVMAQEYDLVAEAV